MQTPAEQSLHGRDNAEWNAGAVGDRSRFATLGRCVPSWSDECRRGLRGHGQPQYQCCYMFGVSELLLLSVNISCSTSVYKRLILLLDVLLKKNCLQTLTNHLLAMTSHIFPPLMTFRTTSIKPFVTWRPASYHSHLRWSEVQLISASLHLLCESGD